MNSIKVDYMKAKQAFDEYHGIITVPREDFEYEPIRSEQVQTYDDDGNHCRGQVRSVYKQDGKDLVDIFLNYLNGKMGNIKW